MSIFDWVGGLFRPRPKPPPPATGLGSDLLSETNKARSARGLAAYAADAQLDAMASGHAHNMAASGVMSHAGFQERLDDSGYKYAAAAENVAAGYDTATACVEGWAGSPGHAANMFGTYVHAGSGSAQAGGVWYWCAVYGTPR